MAVGRQVNVWFGKHDQDLLAMLEQPGVNVSGTIKQALRAYVEGNKPSVIAEAIVDELSLRGLFLSYAESGVCVTEEEVEDILTGAVQQFVNDGGSDGK